MNVKMGLSQSPESWCPLPAVGVGVSMGPVLANKMEEKAEGSGTSGKELLPDRKG